MEHPRQSDPSRWYSCPIRTLADGSSDGSHAAGSPAVGVLVGGSLADGGSVGGGSLAVGVLAEVAISAAVVADVAVAAGSLAAGSPTRSPGRRTSRWPSGKCFRSCDLRASAVMKIYGAKRWPPNIATCKMIQDWVA
jgi:hypothetical protein